MQYAIAQSALSTRTFLHRASRLRGRQATTLWLLSILNFAFFAWLSQRHARDPIAIALLGSGYAIAVISQTIGWLLNRTTRLDVAADGLTLHWGGAVLFAPWEDMERITTIKQRWYWNWEGITLRQIHWMNRRWPQWLRPLPRFIPLLGTSGTLWDRTLGDDLRRYAPWLFDAGRRV